MHFVVDASVASSGHDLHAPRRMASGAANSARLVLALDHPIYDCLNFSRSYTASGAMYRKELADTPNIGNTSTKGNGYARIGNVGLGGSEGRTTGQSR